VGAGEEGGQCGNWWNTRSRGPGEKGGYPDLILRERGDEQRRKKKRTIIIKKRESASTKEGKGQAREHKVERGREQKTKRNTKTGCPSARKY